MQPIKIYEDMYELNFFVSYGVSYNEFRKQVKRLTNNDIGKDDDIAMMIDFIKGGKKLYWIWTSKKNISMLMHEITHAIIKSLGDIGFTCNGSSDEAYAYMAEYICRKVVG